MGVYFLQIKMAGIDHSKAGVEVREKFSFTRGAAEAAMQWVKGQGAEGVTLLSTCNRTELWISGQGDPLAFLCSWKKAEIGLWRPFFICREGEDAVGHLLKTACGINSRLFGEDQVITQVREAGEFAREIRCSGPVLDTLFRTAVTAAKQVKTQVRLTSAQPSAAASAADLLCREWGSLSGKKVLVVGSGLMARMTAEALVSRGAAVSMTLRQRGAGETVLPKGCTAVPYEARMEEMEGADAVISATASPHYTIHFADAAALRRIPRIFIDLAVPRDIEPAIAHLPGVSLWDIDRLGEPGRENAQSRAFALVQAEAILAGYQTRFREWYIQRQRAPQIERASKELAVDLAARMEKCVRSLHLSPEEAAFLREQLLHHGEKAAARLLFRMDMDSFREERT